VLATAVGALFMLGRQHSEQYLIAIGSDVDEWSQLATSVALDERDDRDLDGSVDIVAVSTGVDSSLTDSQQRTLDTTTIAVRDELTIISLDELREAGHSRLVWLGEPPTDLDESVETVRWPLPERDAEADDTEAVDRKLRTEISTLLDQFE